MDAIEILRDLESAGFDRRQAEAIAGAVDKATTGPSVRLATKDDISELRTELRTEIAAVRTELHRELGALAWKAAALLLGQAAFIIAVLKLAP